MKLSEYLKKWRADRPDEWVMDEFIRDAEELEKALIDFDSAFMSEDIHLLGKAHEEARKSLRINEKELSLDKTPQTMQQ